MKRLERMVDLIGVIGIEQSATRISLDQPEHIDLFQTLSDDLLNRKIREKINQSFLAKADTTLQTEDGAVTVNSSDVSPADRKALLNMIKQVKGVKSVKVG